MASNTGIFSCIVTQPAVNKFVAIAEQSLVQVNQDVSNIQNDHPTHEGGDQCTNSLSDFLFHKLNQTCLAPPTFFLTITIDLQVGVPPLGYQYIDVNVPFGCVCIITIHMVGKLIRHRYNAVVNGHSLSSPTQRTQWHQDTNDPDETVCIFCKAI
jgi:hypothetical protein